MISVLEAADTWFRRAGSYFGPVRGLARWSVHWLRRTLTRCGGLPSSQIGEQLRVFRLRCAPLNRQPNLWNVGWFRKGWSQVIVVF